MITFNGIKQAWRLRKSWGRAQHLAQDNQALVRAVRDNPFQVGDHVQHGFFGWRGIVDSLQTSNGGMAGVCVIWRDPETYQVVDEPAGTPVWYPAMSLSRDFG